MPFPPPFSPPFPLPSANTPPKASTHAAIHKSIIAYFSTSVHQRNMPSCRFTCPHPGPPFPAYRLPSQFSCSGAPTPTFPHPCYACSLLAAHTAIEEIYQQQDPAIDDLERRLDIGRRELWYQWEEYMAGKYEIAKRVHRGLVEKREGDVDRVRRELEGVWGVKMEDDER